jgi:hypothetical protein
VEEGAGDLDRVVGRLQKWFGREVSAERILSAFDLLKGFLQQGESGIPFHGACGFGLPVVGESHAELVQPLVVDAPCHASRLAQDGQAGFGVADVLVGEALAALVHLDAALGHQRPGHEDAVRRGDRAVSLVGGHVHRLRAERGSPAHGVALIADVAEVERFGDFRQIPAHHLLVATEAGAGKDERFVFDLVTRSVRSFVSNRTVRDIGDASRSQDIDVGAGAEQRGHERLAGLLRHCVHP